MSADRQASSSTAPTQEFSSTIQLLALCPLLAVSDTVVKALGLSAAVLLIVPLATLIATPMRRRHDSPGSFAAAMLLIAAIVAAVELLMRAWFDELHEALGVFLPLIVANLAIADCAAGPAQDESAAQWPALRRSLKLAIGIAMTLLVLGIARELVGRGSLLHDAGLMLGAWAGRFETNVFRVDMGFLLAMLPPGAFIALGLLIAARHWLMRGSRLEQDMSN